jgi:CRISPR system Cascade subunit CasC
MSTFIQVHLLIPYPPSNPNRDDLGRPKTAVMGGAERLRISSQCLKRAWRESEVFEEAVKGHKGTRTKALGEQVKEKLLAKGVAAARAEKAAEKIAAVFGKLGGPEEAETEERQKGKKKKSLKLQQLAHISPEELAAVDALIEKIASTKEEPTEEDLELLRKDHTAADIGLFGRMLADKPNFNCEAAAQVAHAITVHHVAIEDDFFTAVDDLNTGEEDRGAGHMGVAEFGAGLFYLYLCIDKSLLVKNMQGDQKLANRALAALIEAAATVAPSGKQNSFANRTRALYLLAEKGSQQPRSLAAAFLKPVAGADQMPAAVAALRDTCAKMDAAYGMTADNRREMDVLAGAGTLKDVIAFAVEATITE